MIVAIGIDSIEIERFNHWQSYAKTTLQRIFSTYEIDYCLKSPINSAQRFAVRFAAREAFYKALCGLDLSLKISFLTTCKHIRVERTKNGYQKLIIDWQTLIGDNNMRILHPPLISHLSLTHNRTIASACVVLERL